MEYVLSVLAVAAGVFAWALALANPRQLIPTSWFRRRWLRVSLTALAALLAFLGWLYWPRPTLAGEASFASLVLKQIGQVVASLSLVGGLVLIVLGAVGLATRRVPIFNLKGDLAVIGVFVLGVGCSVLSSVGLFALGSAFLPSRSVNVTAIPATATIKIIGGKYIGRTGPLTLSDDFYSVVASAPNYHTLKTTLDIRKQRAFTLTLKPFTAQESATIRAQQEAKRQEAARKVAQAKAAAKRKAAAAKAAAQRAAAEAKAREKAQTLADAAAAQQAAQDRIVADNKAKAINEVDFDVACEDLVRQNLKAPNTAKFPGAWAQLNDPSLQPVQADDGSWRMSSHVDAQNLFGVELRTNFVCTYSLDDGVVRVELSE